MPGHAGLDLFQVDVSAVEEKFSYQTAVLIRLLIDDRYVLTKNHFRQILL
jgi:hypothetical protein